MARQYSMPYQFPPVALIPPQAGGSGFTPTVYNSLRNAQKAWIVAHINQGNAATILLSLLQATSSAGAGSKAVSNAVPIWLVDAATSADALVAQTAATTFTTDANVADKIIIFEITPEIALDMANGFNHIAISAGASNAANLLSATLFVWGATEGATPSFPTTIV